MSFGRPPGPPASQQQLNELLELLERAGHSDFRDARGPMGFNQRQAGGRFTRDEAQAFIDELIAEEDARLDPPAPKLELVKPPAPDPESQVTSAETTPDRRLERVSDEDLAAELRRRGWTVTHG